MPFLERASKDLSSELSRTHGGDANHCKNVHHPLSTLPVGIGNTPANFKTNQSASLSNECPGIFCSWPNWRGEKGLLLEGARRRAAL